MSNSEPTKGSKYEEAIQRMACFVDRMQCIRALSEEAEDLGNTLDALSIQRENLEGALLMVLLGGTGVGKSTLLNALAGEEIATASPIRPCTTTTTFYSHKENNLTPISSVITDEDRLATNTSEGLRRKIIIDPPDFDSMLLSNRRKLLEVLKVADVILCVVDSEKYRNLSLFRLLARFRRGRTFLFLMNKADFGIDPNVVEDFRKSLAIAGIEDARVFQVSARNAFRMKSMEDPGLDAGDFADMEDVIRKEIDRAAIERIKTSNLTALLSNTYASIDEALPADFEDALRELPVFAEQHAELGGKRIASELSRALFEEDPKIRRCLLTAGSLSIGGLFGLYLAIADKISGLIAPRLGAAKAQDPIELRASVRKALENADWERIRVLIDRFGSETSARLGALGIRAEEERIRRMIPSAPAVAKSLVTAARELAVERTGRFLEKSASGFLRSLGYNLLPLSLIGYFIYVAVVRLGRGDLLEASYFLTFFGILFVLFILQHVFAERGFRRRGGKFMTDLEHSLENDLRNRLQGILVPEIKNFSKTLLDELKEFRAVKTLLR